MDDVWFYEAYSTGISDETKDFMENLLISALAFWEKHGWKFIIFKILNFRKSNF